MIEVCTKSVEDTQSLAAELSALARRGDVILLVGDLGTGKTAFAQGFGQGLGIDEPITSPTFTLMRSYEGRLRLLHVDVYRLDHLQEAEDLGLSELLDEGAVVLVEWGDMVIPTLPADFLEVHFEAGPGNDERRIGLRPVGPRWSDRAPALRLTVERWSTST